MVSYDGKLTKLAQCSNQGQVYMTTNQGQVKMTTTQLDANYLDWITYETPSRDQEPTWIVFKSLCLEKYNNGNINMHNP